MAESVWDYPRPPALVPEKRRLKVIIGSEVVAETTRGYAVKETSHPPTFYFPLDDVRTDLLSPLPTRRSFCEWKGEAAYWQHPKAGLIGWSYPSPTERFTAIQDYLCFYPSRVSEAYVDGERVQAQEGDFYGGWITSDLIGPFKGGPGTLGW